MDKAFDNFYNYKGFGPNKNVEIPSEATCQFYSGILPDQLISYWKEFGFSSWANGIFWTVNPSDYTEVLKAWLEGTDFAEKDDYFVVARTAFGTLMLFGIETGYSLKIDPLWGMFAPSDQTEKMKSRGADAMTSSFFAVKSIEACDQEDEDDKQLFDRAVAKLGPIQSDEMYAFVPALALGGSNNLKNLKKVKTIEHLLFLAELGEKRILRDASKPLV